MHYLLDSKNHITGESTVWCLARAFGQISDLASDGKKRATFVALLFDQVRISKILSACSLLNCLLTRPTTVHSV